MCDTCKNTGFYRSPTARWLACAPEPCPVCATGAMKRRAQRRREEVAARYDRFALTDPSILDATTE